MLVDRGDCVAAETVLPAGLVIGGVNANPVMGKVPVDAQFRRSLNGESVVRTLHASNVSDVLGVVGQLLLRHGDLLLLQEPVRATAGGPVIAVVRVYAAMQPTQQRAAAEVRTTTIGLAIGLLVFWAVLFRLVWHASRELTEQSRVNAHLATHDALTGLPNRVLLRDRTRQAIAVSRRAGMHVGLILIDLDRFKDVNDTLGHGAGDALLKQVADRLRKVVRVSDTVARLGSDEFVVMLPDLRDMDPVTTVARKLTDAVQSPFVIDGVVVDVGCSAGVAVTPDHGTDFDQLMQHTDMAMYVAKAERLDVVLYQPEYDSHSDGRLSLLGELRRAIDNPDQIVLHYQPKASLPTGDVSAVEALVRWQHPDLGLIPPSDFIPLAEQTGLIRPLTWAILRKACEANREWASRGLELSVAVNVSVRCLFDADFPDDLVRLLAESGVPTERLELELTESAVMSNPERALTILRRLAARGIRLSIDDFGTGYSSMAYLKQLPVNQIKIDQTFVTGMDGDPSDAAIVRSSIELARSLSLEVVAEGVETRAVWDRLVELGCPTAQGYFISTPLPSDELVQWLLDRRSSRLVLATR